jgi:hypothetical protein
MRAKERGVTEEEVIDVIRSGFIIPAKHGRKGKAKIYSFGKRRLNKYYEQKRVEVFYKDEEDCIITITVFAFYGHWES